MKGKGDVTLSGFDYFLIKKVLKAINSPDDARSGFDIFDIYRLVIERETEYRHGAAIVDSPLPFIEKVAAAVALCIADELISIETIRGEKFYHISPQGILIVSDEDEADEQKTAKPSEETAIAETLAAASLAPVKAKSDQSHLKITPEVEQPSNELSVYDVGLYRVQPPRAYQARAG